MIQDIDPSKLNNSFSAQTPTDSDWLLFFDKEGQLTARIENNEVIFTKYGSYHNVETVYLFSVDDERYFLALDGNVSLPDGFGRFNIRELRDNCTGKTLYAAFTAYHLWKWYFDNRFCGKCGESLVPDSRERALRCTGCGNLIFPRINPAVIVGVVKGDSILITRYKRGYAHNALVAGFTEIGETLEQSVEREVMEETGIKVRNIRYYKSQPWGMAQDILVGFFCEADEDCTIHMDSDELKYAEWVRREEIVLQPNDLSLTNEMMKVFKSGTLDL